MVKFYAYFILARKFPDLSFSLKFKTSSPPTPYYSLSLYILGIYALRVTPKLPPGSRFTWFAASAERKLILKVEKSMNPEVLGCFSQFSNFSDFSWFCDALAINFDCLAWFPARERLQIDRTSNFKLIQILVFICSSGVVRRSCFSMSNISNLATKLRPADAKCSSATWKID